MSNRDKAIILKCDSVYTDLGISSFTLILTRLMQEIKIVKRDN